MSTQRKKSDDGSFSFYLPNTEDTRRKEILDMREVRNVNNEVQIFSGYGMIGGRVQGKIYQIPESTVAEIRPGDPFAVTFDDLPKSFNIKARIKTCKWAPGEYEGDTWHFLIEGYIESMWSLQRSPILSIKSDNLLNIYEMLTRAISVSFQRTPEVRPGIINGKGVGIFKYNSLFMDGTTRLMDIFEDYVKENKMEWYCDPWTNNIFIGSPVPTAVASGPAIDDIAINRIKPFTVGRSTNKVEAVSFVFAGHPKLQVSHSLLLGKVKWKIIRSIYAERGNGYRESSGIAIRNNYTCTSGLVDWINMVPADDRHYYDKERQTKIADVMLADSDFYQEVNSARWKRLTEGSDGRETPEKDFRKYEFFDGKEIGNVVMASPFAGNEIGLKFPVPDGGRFLLIFPEKKKDYAMLTQMIWKEGDQIPTCEAKDLYLRMEKGSLYFDEQNQSWLVKANNVKLEAASPDPATQKPDPTTTTGTFIKLENGGTITVEGSTVKLGKGATLAVVVNGDDVNIDASGFQAWLNTHVHSGVTTGPGSSGPPAVSFVGPKIGDSVASTSKAKAE